MNLIFLNVLIIIFLIVVANIRTDIRIELTRLANRKVEQLKRSLERQGHTFKGKLANSIKYKIYVQSSGDFRVEYYWLFYGDLLNEGTKNMGRLNEAGRARLISWLIQKKKVNRLKARGITYMIQRKWRKSGYPNKHSGNSRVRGWANIAFSSKEIAQDKILYRDMLVRAFNSQLQDRIAKLNRNR